MEHRRSRNGGFRCLLLAAVLMSAVVAVALASVEADRSACPFASSENRSVGVDIVGDPACGLTLDPSLGCIDAHCRYCQARPTPDSSQYYPCSPSPTPVESTHSASPAQSPPAECVALVSSTEATAGLSAVEDSMCAIDTMNCVSASCRLCRISDETSGLDAFRSCTELQPSAAQPQGEQFCGMQVPSILSTQGVAVFTDPSCSESSPDCVGICRYCKLLDSTVTGLGLCPSAVAATAATASAYPTSTRAAVNGSGAAASPPSPCEVSLPVEQQGVGLDVITDSSCADLGSSPHFGCFTPSCRLCKRFESAYSSDLPSCEATADAPEGTIATPAATSANMTVVESVCSTPSPPGASELGLFVVTDATCASSSSNGFGCLSATCRVCKVYNSMLTTWLPFCETDRAEASDSQNAEPVALTNDAASGGSEQDAQLEGDGDGDQLSPGVLIAVAIAVGVVSTLGIVGLKRMATRRSQRQLERDNLKKYGGHIAV